MARKKSQTLTDGELRIMTVVWELEEASVRAVTERLCSKEKVAYNTVQTMLRILEEKGCLQHRKDGRAFYYSALIDRSAARRTALRHMVQGFFGGSTQALVQNLLQDDQLDAMEIDALKAMIHDSDQGEVMPESGLTEFAVSLLLNHLIQGLAMTALVAVLLWRLKLNAATRHIVWSITLLFVCLLPLIAFVPRFESLPGSMDVTPPTLDQAPTVLVQPEARPSRASDRAVQVGPPSPQTAWLGLFMFLTWFSGVILSVGLLVRRLVQTRSLRRQSKPCDPLIRSSMADLMNQLGMDDEVTLRVIDGIEAPMTVGLIRPWVALPGSWAGRASNEVFRHAMLHELAHIRRRDTWLVLMQRLLQNLFFFHPAVWLVARQMEVERESACDDWAIARSHSAGNYASSLVAIAESVNLHNHAVLAVGCLRSRSQLRKRITHMLNRNSDHSTRPRRWGILVSLLTMGTVAAAAAQSWPQHQGIFAEVGQDIFLGKTLAGNNHNEKITEADGLLYAAWRGDEALAQRLLAEGADADRVYRNRSSPRTALNAAAGAGHLPLVRLLVENGAQVNRVVRGDAPALTAASRNGRFEVAEYLLANGADADNRTRGDGSPLIAAAASGSLELVEMLLDSGADPDAAVRGDGSPLIAAARNGSLAIVETLLAAGADPDRYVRGDEAPLYHAVTGGRIDIVEVLLENGANADASYPGDGTPLMLAIRRGRTEIADLLMAYGAGVDTSVSGDGTALIEAARRGDLDFAKTLIRAGADVNRSVSGDGNPLINAAMNARLDMARLLVASGAEVNVHVRGDDTPLINAVRSGDMVLVDYLLSEGADVDLAGDYDRNLKQVRTPLNQAIKHSSEEIAGQLRAAGAR